MITPSSFSAVNAEIGERTIQFLQEITGAIHLMVYTLSFSKSENRFSFRSKIR